MSFLTDVEAEVVAFVKKEEANIVAFAKKEEAVFVPLAKATAQEAVTIGAPIVLNALGAITTGLASGGVNLAPIVSTFMVALGNAGKFLAVQDAQATIQVIANQIRSGAAALTTAVGS